MITIKTDEDIKKIIEGGKILAKILNELSEFVKPGVSAKKIDDLGFNLAKKYGAKPAFLNYKPDGADTPYPASVCVSINDEIVHGIPFVDKVIKEGDVVSVDMGLIYKGLITDSAVTIFVDGENVSTEERKRINKIIDITKKSLYIGIEMAVAGNKVGQISNAIGTFLKNNKYGIVQGLAGHGVGYSVHEEPYIPNEGKNSEGPVLKAGMVIAIEPMACFGKEGIVLDEDGHTYKTIDGEISTHFEHTVIITNGKPIVATML